MAPGIFKLCNDWMQDEIKSVYYEEAALEQMEANAAME